MTFGVGQDRVSAARPDHMTRKKRSARRKHVRLVRAVHVPGHRQRRRVRPARRADSAAIRKHEPGTLVYAVHKVEGQPLQRIFYELYRDGGAFDAHEGQAHTCFFPTEREQYLAPVEVDFLTLQVGKGTAG